MWSSCAENMDMYLEYLTVGVLQGKIVVCHGDKLNKQSFPSGFVMCCAIQVKHVPSWPSLACKLRTAMFSLVVSSLLSQLLPWSYRSTKWANL